MFLSLKLLKLLKLLILLADDFLRASAFLASVTLNALNHSPPDNLPHSAQPTKKNSFGSPLTPLTTLNALNHSPPNNLTHSAQPTHKTASGHP